MRLPYFARRWYQWNEWRFLFRRVRGYFVRGYRGWADWDTWALDTYLCYILAGALRHLAKHSHGCPTDIYEVWGDRGFEIWKDWLLEKAEWFEWRYKDEDGTSNDKGWITPGMSDQEKKARIDAYGAKLEKFYDEVLPNFIKRWGNLWD